MGKIIVVLTALTIAAFGPLQTAGAVTVGQMTPDTAAFCQAEPAVTALGGGVIHYSGRLVCGGDQPVGSTKIEICPAEYYGGRWHTATSKKSCRIARGFGSISVGLNRGHCSIGKPYHTWIWDYVPELDPSITVGHSAAVICK
jgi:hypothetical protein